MALVSRGLALAVSSLCVAAFAAEPAVQVTRDGATVKYDGEITAAAVEVLIKHIDEGARHIEINSVGGDAAAGVAIGKKMRQVGVSIRVPKYCISSCANYLFLAATEKSLAPDAVLGLHGAMYRDKDAIFNSKTATPVEAFVHQIIEDSQGLYDAISFDTALFDRSFSLTKLLVPAMKAEVKHKDGSKRHFDDFEAARAYASKLKRGKKFERLTASFTSTSATTLYFPDQKTLESCGVTQITAYPYPATPAAMLDRGRKVGAKLEFVGDFRTEASPGFVCKAVTANTQ